MTISTKHVNGPVHNLLMQVFTRSEIEKIYRLQISNCQSIHFFNFWNCVPAALCTGRTVYRPPRPAPPRPPGKLKQYTGYKLVIVSQYIFLTFGTVYRPHCVPPRPRPAPAPPCPAPPRPYILQSSWIMENALTKTAGKSGREHCPVYLRENVVGLKQSREMLRAMGAHQWMLPITVKNQA